MSHERKPLKVNEAKSFALRVMTERMKRLGAKQRKELIDALQDAYFITDGTLCYFVRFADDNPVGSDLLFLLDEPKRPGGDVWYRAFPHSWELLWTENEKQKLATLENPDDVAEKVITWQASQYSNYTLKSYAVVRRMSKDFASTAVRLARNV